MDALLERCIESRASVAAIQAKFKSYFHIMLDVPDVMQRFHYLCKQRREQSTTMQVGNLTKDIINQCPDALTLLFTSLCQRYNELGESLKMLSHVITDSRVDIESFIQASNKDEFIIMRKPVVEVVPVEDRNQDDTGD